MDPEQEQDVFDTVIEQLQTLRHAHYWERVIAYLLYRYVPGMKLHLTADEYLAVGKEMSGSGLTLHSHITDNGMAVTVELQNVQQEPHSEFVQ